MKSFTWLYICVLCSKRGFMRCSFLWKCAAVALDDCLGSQQAPESLLRLDIMKKQALDTASFGPRTQVTQGPAAFLFPDFWVNIC